MAEHDDEALNSSSAVEKHGTTTTSAGIAVLPTDPFENPGEPPHRARRTDVDPKKQRLAERQVATFFYLSIVGSVLAIAAYVAFPIDSDDFGTVRTANLWLGLSIALALLALGLGAVYWSKSLVVDREITELRHGTRGTDATRAKAVEAFQLADKESGFSRRKLIRNSMIGALAAFPLPGIVLVRDLAPAADPNELLRHTMWAKGTRLTKDPTGLPIKASDVTIGSVFHVIPDGMLDKEDMLEEKAKASVLLMRLDPKDLNPSKGHENWGYDGIVAYSKICTHVGCPVALYEQQTHHLLCPCHQSTFDVSNNCEVIFGPAARPLPQLPIAIDDDGYLVAQSDFHEPVGPSFWERER
ncbi:MULTISPECIES: ubiquinol-cytochrome c reductase iron-sulfur subunit [unclassified Curtobacterium]|jgi:ubiquinol-cytochrome c reductase iron-sulfur subunit|uniref:cytochrome bc1 complex Rieske iron-sulfur subunit n=1 Tax=unclassified Curtobacterium TaxID=257496 RepID=UPI00089DE928|nr:MULTISPECIES: Rieske (2Fe-2S) protein [unclassified Curtobacterium]AOX67297.1 ubiquinol-cytochrome C reductase [Curtobacterium sp. BH-2-1-1]MCC8908107.1 Rieske (2Fe-2S) protein [Curtobacterium sp. GD1]MCT9622078.1 Rieske (2Fe-2S) protein [Curtobacterium sp. C2H10]MDR6171641.1 ubiquinol-cytochrome c reductase iron-sulfur subunit [Curtobacterium sp. SORGH_AS_0776]MDR6574727.1 ubiquinol-cytochrome c reductase iron-sulfur subunit [Curtobacterium sp. 320]